jgi:glycosyltransferase involved in cell wall biosynthesis
MRIAVIETTPYSGLLHYSVQLGNALAERGNDVDLLTPREHELSKLEGAARMRAVLTPPVRSTDPPPPGRLATFIKRAGVAVRMTRAWARILWEVAWGGYDVVILDAALDVSVAAAGAAALTAIPGGPPVAEICHNARIFNRWGGGGRYGGSPLLRLLLRTAFGRFDLIFMHGERSREEFESHWEKTRIALIPHGDERVFAGEPSPPSDEQHILFFGHWNRVKGIPVLMDAFDELAARLPDATLTIAGAANPQEVDVGKIERWAAGHRGRVELIDRYVPLDDVPALFARAAVVVTPYVAGYQSGIVHLAMTMARPVVASDIGDFGSAVIAGETGLLVPPADPQALAGALATVLEDPELARRMGSKGHERVMSESAWETVAESVEAHLKAIA